MKAHMRLAAALACLITLALLLGAAPCPAQTARPLAKAQTIYVPCYPFVPYGPKAHTLSLSSTLCIRNLDLSRSIQVTRISYHDASGNLVKQVLQAPLTIPALGAAHFVAPVMEKAKGMGHGFVVEWRSAQAVAAPLAQVVAVGTAGQQGISFVNDGVVLK